MAFIILRLAGALLRRKLFRKPLDLSASIETASRIENSDKVSALHAATYRYDARVREIELQFEAKIAELREAYLGEVADIHGEAA
jgi:hypothetical protein